MGGSLTYLDGSAKLIAGMKAQRKQDPPADPGLGRMFFEDLRRARLQRTYAQEIKDLYHFYLDEKTRSKLNRMGRFQRAFVLLAWLFKSLLTKLSPGRRVALLVACIFTVLGKTGFGIDALGFNLNHDLRPWGFVILLVVLMLELKDKLVAKDEIQIARQVQVMLFPRSHPRMPGWSVWSISRPANDVGGDLIDYVELDGFRHAVVLGDVAGKGLGASLLSAQLQATVRALAVHAASLDDLAAQVNETMLRDGISNRFATLFYAELQYDSGSLRYVNAGHNPALVIRRNGVDRLGASSVPLGMMEGSDYDEVATHLEPGEMLLIYSDGVTEAENGEAAEFGLERLEALTPHLRDLDPESAGHRVLEEIDGFLDGLRPADDLSMVIVRRHDV
ncbi:MAG: SpoIIE family protein phosphatase [Acidobacteria bacterium]|nr:SpoIIE family protein phosphatase [Acidobacteriota bacterium]NIM60213.1 SpoIIE family protein phosphatase [Acidobacteriota bacterium]NIO60251.1 SpoIIE family protein phosphatase [Acidobacteriota bacterium]NIQ31306.1 SpoIIE family protein phosphatase [Acidobacteriota bacterium]NIQ86529.1 SpoIIE family protein phosphatase [Acidobacteriota bacterium]